MLLRFYSKVSAADLSVVDESIAEDFIEHEEFPGIEPNKEGVKQFFAMFRSAFPDLRMEPHEILAEGDLVSCRGTFTGTHQGEFMGVPPTGRHIEADAIDILRIRDGQFVEHWGVMDAMTLMQQIGALAEQTPA